MAKEIFDILTFDYNLVTDIDITTTDPDWTDVISVSTLDREPGTYKATFSLKFHLNSTSQSFLYRFSLDGGATWGIPYEKEVKDKHNTEVVEVIDIIEHTGGQIEVFCQCTREGHAACEVLKGFISVERKS